MVALTPDSEALADLLAEEYGSAGHQIFIVNRDQRLIYMNPAFADLVGLKLDDVRGREVPLPWSDEEMTDGIRTFLDLWMAGELREHIVGITVRYRHSSGRRFQVLLSPILVRDETGEPTAIVYLITDLTQKPPEAISHHNWMHARLQVLETSIRDAAQALERGGATLAFQSVTQRDPSELGSLSSRERQVYRALIDGQRAPEIARSLGISPHTVRSHTRSILQKLKVNSQLELVRRYAGQS